MAEQALLEDDILQVGKAGRDESLKRRQVMKGARQIFLEDGFDGASMNDIARAAGVSKGTLYVYFSSKEDLFAALIREEKRAQAEQLCEFLSYEKDLRTGLQQIGVRLIELILRPASVAHLRTVVAAAGKFPEIGRAFYDSGPAFGHRRMAQFLEAQIAAGAPLDIDDAGTAAGHFCEMCKAHYVIRAVLNVGVPPTPAEIEAHVANTVEVFLRAYGLRKA